MLVVRAGVRDYAWGRVDGMAPLIGSPPSGGPEAELWLGTHPGEPTIVEDTGRTLAEIVAADPARWLGDALAASGADALPFLLKVLAIGRPLSLQAHPSTDQAAAGFAREERAGIPLDAPHRTYRDPGPKPEALVALEPTWALCGFRELGTARALVEGLAVPSLAPLAEAIGGPDGLRAALGTVLRFDPATSAAVCRDLAAVVPPDPNAPLDTTDPSSEGNARAWIARLQAAFPGDASAVAPLFVEVIRLDSGEAVHLPAGNLHAYLSGAGVEIMSSSDNVLRGGLTPKHIDVDELLEILRFEPGVPPPPVRRDLGVGIVGFDCGEGAFALASVTPGDGSVRFTPRQVSVLLATGGPVEVTVGGETVTLEGTRAVAVAAGEGPVTARGAGRLWWATTGDGLV